MHSRRIPALLLIVLLLAFCAAPAAAAAESAGPPPLVLICEEIPGGSRVISGLTVSRQAIPASTLLPLTRSATSADAAYPEGTAPDAPAATGLEVSWTDLDNNRIDARFVVRGDVLGTGIMSLSQLTRLASAYCGTQPLEGVYLAAADLDGSGGLTLTDLVRAYSMYADVPALTEQAQQAIIQEAVEVQAGDGSSYHADVFHVEQLKEGDVIYGMLSGQSAFYTDGATVEACYGSYIVMYEALQMLPHPEYGYRTQLGVYRVKEDLWVAAGYCLANSEINGTYSGPGGGYQYVIPNYEEVLELTQTVDLHA